VLGPWLRIEGGIVDMTVQNNGFAAEAGQPVPAGPAQVPPETAGPVPVAPGSPAAADPAIPVAPDPAGMAGTPPRQHVIRRTRVGGVWVTLAISAVVLILLLVFILGNLKRADVSIFGAHANLPLGVALLLSAAAGALIVIIPGTGRILQLRRTARRHRRQDAQPGDASSPASP
jgi:uncharacterized integral membrane protein